MNISQLSNLVGQKAVYSNGEARITDATKVDPAILPASEPPSAIYHGSEDYALLTGGQDNVDVPIAYSFDPKLMAAQKSEMFSLLTHGLAKASADLRYSYDSAIQSLSSELQQKDWGFSISDGLLTFTAGRDELSNNEINSLKKAFAGADVEYYADNLASTMVRVLELDRGYDGVSKGIGRYDVTDKNFGEIVDLRSFLHSHGPEGKYGRWHKDPTDYESLYFLTGGHVLMDQISANATERYMKG